MGIPPFLNGDYDISWEAGKIHLSQFLDELQSAVEFQDKIGAILIKEPSSVLLVGEAPPAAELQ